MKTCDIYQFISLLRLGCWSGGDVDRLGYISTAREADGDMGLAGLRGLWLGGGLTLEKSRPDPESGMTILFSVYDPYTGEYRFYEASARMLEDDPGVILREMIAETERSNRRGGRKTYTESPYRQQKRYDAHHYSMHGGTVNKPKGRKQG